MGIEGSRKFQAAFQSRRGKDDMAWLSKAFAPSKAAAPAAPSAPSAPAAPTAAPDGSYAAPGRAASYLAFDAPRAMDDEEEDPRRRMGGGGMSLSRQLLLGSNQMQTLG